MRRRTWILLGALVLAAAGVAIGSIVATGLGGGGGSARPTGAETVVRIELAQERVSCGSGPVAVFIFLDDLATRPSPVQPEISYGMAGFQFLLRYDPQILRVGGAGNIEVNPQLSQDDPDGDGVLRSFFPVSDIDDYAGRAVLGAASFVPSLPGPEYQREEGVDPVAKGEPVLLMTVRLLPIGHGASALSLEPGTDRQPEFEEPQLLDPAGERYEPVRLTGADLTVEGGDCPVPSPAIPRPTVGPTSTRAPLVPPLPTPVPWRTVTAPLAPDAGRTDCAADWVAYTDSEDRYSVCYPAGFRAVASDTAVNLGNAEVTIEDEGVDSLSIAIAWRERPFTIYHPPSPENCLHYSVMADSREFVELSLAGLTVPACFTQGFVLESDPPLPVGTLQGAIPLAADGSEREGFIVFSFGFTGPDVAQVPAVGQRALETLIIDFR